MIDDPPLLTIRRRFDRPTAMQIKALAGVPTGNVADAMGGRGALAPSVKPLSPNMTLVGPAVTCYAGPADNLALFAALDIAEPGDVLVAAADGFTDAAITGDLLVGMMRNKGVAGFVTDTAVRDVAGILETGLPVYCAGVTPNSPARNGPGTAGQPVDVGGMRIESGDVLVGDGDGIVVIPHAALAGTLEQLESVSAAEAALASDVAAGLVMPDFAKAILTSDRVVEID